MASNNNQNEEIRKTPEVFQEETVKLLSKGLLENYTPGLENVKKQLRELTDKQNALIQKMHDENLQVSAVQHSHELQDIFSSIKTYQNKLSNVKKDMRSLHEKSTKLKKRALRLQQYAEKEAYLKQQQRETRTRLEEELIAKPSTSSAI